MGWWQRDGPTDRRACCSLLRGSDTKADAGLRPQAGIRSIGSAWQSVRSIAARTRSCQAPEAEPPIEGLQEVFGAFRASEWWDSGILTEHLRHAACLKPR